MPLVSIIMPCHNGEKYLSESINSVISQNYEDWELLVIDDLSEDNSVQIIKDFEKKDIRIKYLKNNDHTGKPYSPRNFGIAHAGGRYIAFLDCDDKWLPSKLQNQMRLFEKDDCVIVYSFYQKMDEYGNVHNSIITSPSSVTYRQLLNGNCIGNLTGMYDTAKVGKIFQKDFGHEDYLMWLDILKSGYTAYSTNSIEAVYREQKSSTSGNKLQAFKWTWNIYRKGLKLSLFSSVCHFIAYAVKGVLKYIK